MTGKAFERLREKHGIKRADFVRYAGVAYHTAWRWERYETNPPPAWAARLLLAYIEKIEAARREAGHAADTTA